MRDALEAGEAQPKVEGRMSGGRLALERHYRANADLLTTRAAAQALIDIDHDAARASEVALKEENAKLRRGYVPQDIAMECLTALAPLDKPGEPNTLWALVRKAMATIGALSKRVEELERFIETVKASGKGCDPNSADPGEAILGRMREAAEMLP